MHLRVCMNARMRVIKHAWLRLCEFLSFYESLSVCSARKHVLQTVRVFVCGDQSVWAQISVCLCFLSVCGNVSLSPAYTTLHQSGAAVTSAAAQTGETLQKR